MNFGTRSWLETLIFFKFSGSSFSSNLYFSLRHNKRDEKSINTTRSRFTLNLLHNTFRACSTLLRICEETENRERTLARMKWNVQITGNNAMISEQRKFSFREPRTEFSSKVFIISLSQHRESTRDDQENLTMSAMTSRTYPLNLRTSSTMLLLIT